MNKAQKSILGALTLVFDSILKKLIGLISTLILARVLLPEDFGLIAFVMIVLGFAEVFSTTGTDPYILQKESVSEEDLNSAFTLDLCLKLVIFFSLIISAPFIAEYKAMPELEYAIQAISFMVLFGAFRNPGIFLLKREQKYKPIFKISLASKLISVPVTIGIALIYQSYWALIIGHLVSLGTRIIGTYLIHPHRPKICFSGIKEQWLFSRWMIPQSIVGYVRAQLDTFLVSHFYGEKQLGSYHVMKYISFMPSSELVIPATQPLLAELAKVKNDQPSFQYQFNLSFLVIFAVALPIATFLYVYDELFVVILLGQNWIMYADVFGYMALLGISSVFLNQSIRVLLVYKRTKIIFYYELLAFFGIYGMLLISGFDDIVSFTATRVALENIFCLSLFLSVSVFVLKRKVFYLLRLSLPVIVITLGSAEISTQIELSNFNSLIQLLFYGAAYGSLYLMFIFVAYHLYYARTPEGRHINHLISKQVTKVRSWSNKGKL